ncbi:MAG: DNA polymerase III subunit beta [Chlamydia sp.]
MKFVMSRNELSELVGTIQNIVAQRAPMPILSNILIEAADSIVTLTATDLTVGIRCTTMAKVLVNGSTTLPAKRFSQLLRELQVAIVEISTNDKNVAQIVADSSKFKMNGMPKEDYPALPDFAGAVKIAMRQSELKEALYRVSFAVSKEDSRYVLTGVSLSLENGKALFIGTDGKRLARCCIDLGSASYGEIEYEAIIPIKAVDEILKNISDGDENAVLYLLQDKIAVETNNRLVMTKLLSGEYPDIDRIIPRQFSFVVAIHREELSVLLRQVSLFISESNYSVRFTLEDGSLQLAANTVDIGEGRVSMPVHYSGPRFDIAFNPSYFLDILRHSREEYVYVGLQDAFNPAMISDALLTLTMEDGFPSPLFILMPMRLTEES